MSRTDLTFEYPGGVSSRAHGACMPVNRASAVACRRSSCIPALYNACVAFASADACDINPVALGKYIDLDFIAYIVGIRVFKPELLKMLFCGDS